MKTKTNKFISSPKKTKSVKWVLPIGNQILNLSIFNICIDSTVDTKKWKNSCMFTFKPKKDFCFLPNIKLSTVEGVDSTSTNCDEERDTNILPLSDISLTKSPCQSRRSYQTSRKNSICASETVLTGDSPPFKLKNMKNFLLRIHPLDKPRKGKIPEAQMLHCLFLIYTWGMAKGIKLILAS